MKKIFLMLLLISTLLSNSCDDSLIDLKIHEKGVSVNSVIEKLARSCGYSIFYESFGELLQKEEVTFMNIENRTINEIIELLLKKYNFHFILEDNILTISKYKTVTFKVDFLDSLRVSSSNVKVDIGANSNQSSYGEGSSNFSTGANITVNENFDFWKSLDKDIKDILSFKKTEQNENRNKVIINSKAGLVTVRGEYKQLVEVEQYIATLLNTLKKQVLIDVKVMSVTLDDSHKTGIDWSKLSIGFNSAGVDTDSRTKGSSLTEKGITSAVASVPGSNSWVVNQSYFNANGFFNFLRGFGDTRSLSSPKILTMNNQPSLVSVGDNINYSVTSSTANDVAVSESTNIKDIFIGVLLDITPQIDEEGFVTLRINPSISDFKYLEDARRQTTRTLPPDTVSRRISSVVRVKDGDVIILGGLISSSKTNIINKVPLLGDTPFLGNLFKSDSVTDITTEIVFVLTPTIISNEEKPLFNDLGFKSIKRKSFSFK